jgi:hypothetical protein
MVVRTLPKTCSRDLARVTGTGRRRNIMEKLIKALVVAVAFAIACSFVALLIFHVITLKEGIYHRSYEYQETIFISILTLGLAIVLILPYIINKEQVKREIDNYWTKRYQKTMDQFISKSEIDYAHISRMIAYTLKHKRNYYWAMAWASDSIVAYIKRFKECPADFQLNEEYFTFSLMIMKISFYERWKGTFLEDNIDLEEYDSKFDGNYKWHLIFKKYNSKRNEASMNEIRDKINKGKELTLEEKEIWRIFKDFMNEINDKIHKGKELTPEEEKISAVKELKRVIFRYIKWQCIIYIEMQKDKRLSNNVIHLMKEDKKLPYKIIYLMIKYLDEDFETDFKDMVNKTFKSFRYVKEEQFINDIVEKVEPEEQEKVHEYLENMLKERQY